MQNPWASIACLLVFAVSASAAEKSFVVVVEAGDFDRRDSLVEFAVPQAAAGPRDYRYYIQSGEKSAPVQIGKNGLANFRIEEMKKGTRLTYELVRGSLESRRALSESAIYAQREGDKLNLSLVDRTGPADKKRPLMDYQAEPGKFPRDEIKPAFRRGGYLHPIRTPLGRMVTDDFPDRKSVV